MSRVKWSRAQTQHRGKFHAIAYARAAMKDPQLKAYYREMAANRNSRRPFDRAVSDYFQGGDTDNKLLKVFRPPQGDAGVFVETEKVRMLPPKRVVPPIPKDDYCI